VDGTLHTTQLFERPSKILCYWNFPLNKMMDKEAIISALHDAEICDRDDIRGCTPEEVSSFEQAVGLQLPAQYKEFLLAMGHSTDCSLFRNTVIFMSELRGVQDSAVALCRGDYELPKDAFVFSMNDQWYSFLFFKVSEGDDPPIYRYCSMRRGPAVQVCKSFSEFLSNCITEHVEFQNRHYR
jgi:SMI1-KNR4 cell-wall